MGQLDVEKIDVIEAALDALPGGDSPERSRLLATLCSELIFHSPLERRVALADEAKAIVRRLGDRAIFVDVVTRCASALIAPSTLVTEWADYAEAFVAAQDGDDPVRLLFAANSGFHGAIRVGQFELAQERLVMARARADKLGQPLFLWTSTFYEASLALLQGDTEEAERLATAAFEVGSASGQPDAFAFYGIQLMITRFQQGRLGEMLALIADTAEQNPSIPTFTAALAAASFEAGDIVAARELLDEAAAHGFSLPEDSGGSTGS